MKVAGLDIGSRSIELVVLENGKIDITMQADSGFDPLARAMKLLEGVEYDHMVATGYGRQLARVHMGAETVTEIKAYAFGARFLFPEARAILDVGGQDSKAIALNEAGKIVKFEMNDKCAAGTGRFLEVMAQSLGYDLSEMGEQALNAKNSVNINSMCTVFAESEVISLVTRGHDRRDVALGLHKAIARRCAGMLRRVMKTGPLVFAGGVAQNQCMVALMSEFLGQKPLVPKDPQMVGAIGAALIGSKNY